MFRDPFARGNAAFCFHYRWMQLMARWRLARMLPGARYRLLVRWFERRAPRGRSPTARMRAQQVRASEQPVHVLRRPLRRPSAVAVSLALGLRFFMAVRFVRLRRWRCLPAATGDGAAVSGPIGDDPPRCGSGGYLPKTRPGSRETMRGQSTNSKYSSNVRCKKKSLSSLTRKKRLPLWCAIPSKLSI